MWKPFSWHNIKIKTKPDQTLGSFFSWKNVQEPFKSVQAGRKLWNIFLSLNIINTNVDVQVRWLKTYNDKLQKEVWNKQGKDDTQVNSTAALKHNLTWF